MSPIRPLLVTVLLTVVGCVLPEYERPAGKGQANLDSPGAGGAWSKGGSSSSTGAATLGAGGIHSGGLFGGGGETAVDVNAPSSGGMSSAGAGVNSGGAAGSPEELASGGSALASCGGTAGAAGNCDCGTGGSSSCPEGFADCLRPGVCEVELASNVNHCGACGKRCDSLAPASTTLWQCVSGTCTVGQCETGYADCDGLASNGCETNTRVDAMHCGACLNSICKYPVCANGVCPSTTTAGRSVVPSDPATVPDANLLPLPTNTIWVWQTTSLKENDAIVAFGAITNLRGLIYAGTFRMALYDDLNGMPNAPLLTMPLGIALIANDGLQELTLSEPYRVPTSGKYWVAIWSSDKHTIKIVTANILIQERVLSSVADFALGTWPSGTSWSSTLSAVTPPQGYVGFFPSIYVRYVHGESLLAP